MPVRDIKDGTLIVRGAGDPPETLTVTFIEGGLEWTTSEPVKFHSDRGVLKHARKDNEEPLEGSFSIRYDQQGVRDALVNQTFNGTTGTASEPLTVYSGWRNPETKAVVHSGATMFGDTLTSGEIVGGAQRSSNAGDADGVDLEFQISDPAGSGNNETLIFMAVHGESVAFSEGDEADEQSFEFRSAVRRPHIFSP